MPREYFLSDGKLREYPIQEELYVRKRDFEEIGNKLIRQERRLEDYANLQRETYHYSSMIDAVKAEVAKIRLVPGEIPTVDHVTRFSEIAALIGTLMERDYKLPGDALMYRNEFYARPGESGYSA